MMAKVNIQNLPEEVDKYIVARLVMGELWYWGSWDDKDIAKREAEIFHNGILVERDD